MPIDVPQPNMLRTFTNPFVPLTAALQGALPGLRDRSARDDLLFLERWEMAPLVGIGPALRVQQIRRANPDLAEAIRAEVEELRPRSAGSR